MVFDGKRSPFRILNDAAFGRPGPRSWSQNASESADLHQNPWEIFSYGPLPVTSTYNPIYRMYNPIYNQF